MPWQDESPLECLLRFADGVPDVVLATLSDGGDALQVALEVGSPVDTGAFQGSWTTQQTGDLEVTVQPDTPYDAFVTVDTSAAEAVIDNISVDLDDRLDALFRGL